ncbi:MOSC domain-containing protein [Maricaulis sp.]|uniref:MOSC domain-containing protein n=1 Tax=Maricaulis sp. TaxID=1486257 RepID=UPI001B218293|nr:MOSC domain-containing protein [Maricaulis sp.]MBO6797391.1 MOSC domain-containing protein [Maricaulis sp.]
MPKLSAIHRFPVKGFSPQVLDQIELTQGKGLPFDRHWAIENGPGQYDATAPGHVSKKNFLMLAAQSDLAGWSTRFNAEHQIWTVIAPDGTCLQVDLNDAETHAALFDHLSQALSDQVRGRLRLIQAGSQAMTDIPDPYPSIINLASVRDLAERTGQALDPVRFRGNLLIDDLEPWAELDMVGERLVIGEAEVEIRARIRRCVATSINPVTAARDADIPKALFDSFGHMDCGVYVSVERGGSVAAGDRVSGK